MRTDYKWVEGKIGADLGFFDRVKTRLRSYSKSLNSYSAIAPELLRALQSDQPIGQIHSLATQLLSEFHSLTFEFFKYNREGFKQIAKELNHLKLYPELAQKCKQIGICPEAFEAALALRDGVKPKRVSIGASGVYFLMDRLGRQIGVFKPAELEVNRPENSSSRILSSFKFTPETCYQRERAVYLLDREHFASVPHTITVRLPRSGFQNDVLSEHLDPFVTGSFQVFIHETSHFEDVREKDFDPHEIHKIAILDIRILNADRHTENLLANTQQILYPIDHGFCLLDNAAQLKFYAWMEQPEAEAPWTAEELAYISRIDPDKDIATLRKKVSSITEETLLRCKIATLLLKKGASRGLTPFQIGDLMVGKNYAQSYFEMTIFPQISQNPSQIDHILDAEIDQYLRKHR